MSEEESARHEMCDEFGLSLKEDIRVGASIPVGAAIFEIDRANEITEQRLVAMRAMILECRLWARGMRSTDDLAQAMLDHSGVVTTDGNSEEIQARLTTLEGRLETIRDEEGNSAAERLQEDRATAVAAAQNLGEDAARMRTSNDETISDTIARLPPSMRAQAQQEYQAALTDSQIEARFSGLQTRLDRMEGRELRYYQVFFDTLSSDLTPASVETLRRLAENDLRTANGIRVIGYADERGTVELNLSLSTARAAAVQAYLATQGVSVETALGVGETTTFATEHAANRRVIIEATAVRQQAAAQ